MNLTEITAKIDAYAAEQTLPTEQTTTLFRHLLSDALAKATTAEADGTFFVKTGDIPAMWLRDATFQVLPYIKLIDQIPELKTVLVGVLRRELRYVQHDPYANAFNQTASGAHWSDDDSDVPVSDLVWERKFEIDSLCAPLLLALKLSQATADSAYLDTEFWQTVALILTTFETEQHHDQSPYYFKRTDCPENDTLPNEGKGTPVGYTGMIWNGFRPSDNACEYGYHVPANLFVVSVLTKLQPLVPPEWATLKPRMATLVTAIQAGIGSNHTPEAYVWPISLAMEGLTSSDQTKKVAQLAQIAATDNETNQCHESVSVDDASQYTRDWFSWANMTYCELALDVLG